MTPVPWAWMNFPSVSFQSGGDKLAGLSGFRVDSSPEEIGDVRVQIKHQARFRRRANMGLESNGCLFPPAYLIDRAVFFI
jgi:hypothetical protein